MNLTFHKLTTQHLKDMYEIRFSVNENIVHPHQIRYLLKEQAMKDIRQGGGWICKAGPEYAGYGFGLFIPAPIIGGLFVKPEYHNKGIGSQLLEHITRWFFEQNATEITLTTDPGSQAESFYRRRGWIPAGQDEFGQSVLKKQKDRL